MSRKLKTRKREELLDPKYNNPLISRFINKIMLKGKKSIATNIVYDALEIVQEKMKEDALSVFNRALKNVKPLLEVKSRRVGGATYQVPIEVLPDRSVALAYRWIIGFSRARTGKAMAERLAQEIMDAAKNEGASVKKREDTHKMAEANKAFAHYRW
ncbi:MAG: 30S ribosomal protein S7 [bacterium]